MSNLGSYDLIIDQNGWDGQERRKGQGRDTEPVPLSLHSPRYILWVGTISHLKDNWIKILCQAAVAGWDAITIPASHYFLIDKIFYVIYYNCNDNNFVIIINPKNDILVKVMLLLKPSFEDLKKELKNRNINLSYQRLSVLEYLTQNRCHPTVDLYRPS